MQPQDFTDTQINRLVDQGVLPTMRPLNAETVLSENPIGVVIDLRRAYQIEYFQNPAYPNCPKGERVWAYDWNTFDPDPESEGNNIGYGETTHDALLDLLEKIAARVSQ